MANIFQMFGEIFIDNQKANKEIDTTTEKAEKSGSKIGNAFKNIGGAMVKVGSAVVAGATTIGTAAYGLASKVSGQADEVDKMSQKLGLSRTAYQEWDYVLSQAGVEITNMATGMKTLTNKIDDAKNGSASATELFNKLGISMEDLNKMSREEAFDAVIKSMQSMEDSTERAALANDLFGKSGQELTALFNETAESTDALKQKAHELGMIMSDDTVSAGVGLTDTFDTIQKSAAGLLNTLGSAAMPVIQKIADAIVSAIPKVQEMIERIMPVAQQVFDTVVPPLMQLGEALLPTLMSAFEQLMPAFQTLVTSVLPIIVELVQTFAPVLTEIINAVLPTLSELLQLILPPISDLAEAVLPVIKTLIEALLPLLTPLMDAVKSILEAVLVPLIEKLQLFTDKVMPVVQDIITVVAEAISTRLSGALESIKLIFEDVKGVFTGVIDFIKSIFTGDWEGAWNAVADIFGHIWDGIKEAFKVPINWIIDGINGFIRGINKIEIPDWVPLVGGKGFKLSEIPRLRIGMEYVPYDDMPALLHRGERVLTASESKDYSKYERQQTDGSRGRIIVTVQFGEKSIFIERLNGRDENDIDSFADILVEKIQEKIRRKGVAMG